jgi:hypothetical protein
MQVSRGSEGGKDLGLAVFRIRVALQCVEGIDLLIVMCMIPITLAVDVVSHVFAAMRGGVVVIGAGQ